MQHATIHLSTRTIMKVLLTVAAVYVAFLVWDIFLLLFVALILAALIDPFATSLQKRKIPRGIAVLIIYFILFGTIGVAIATLAPIIARDVPLLVENTEVFLRDVQAQPWWGQYFGNSDLVSELTQFFQSDGSISSGALNGVFSTVSGLVAGIVSFILVLVITFYMVVQDDPLNKVLSSILPEAQAKEVLSVLQDIQRTLALWLRGQIILSLIIGVAVFIGLQLLGIKYAAAIALLAALFEFVPYIGPMLAAIPALFFGFIQGGWVMVLLVAALYVFIQQVENHILVPKVMQHAVGLNPIVSIIAILLGVQLAGVLGALLAIPVGASLSVLLRRRFNT